MVKPEKFGHLYLIYHSTVPLRFIKQSYFITIDLHTFYYTPSVPYPGNFGASIPVWVPKKISPKNSAVLHPEVSFFIRQINSFLLSSLKVGHLTCLLLNEVQYGRRKPQRFHTHKKNNSNLNPHALWLLPIKHATGDHSKKLGHFYACFRNIDFNSKQLLGGNGLLSIFFCYLSHQEKNKPVENKFQEVFS